MGTDGNEIRARQGVIVASYADGLAGWGTARRTRTVGVVGQTSISPHINFGNSLSLS